jgi:hypothetical protein
MKPEPGLHPRVLPRGTSSHAECAVYDALKASLPEGWFAWHSLRIMSDTGIFGEGDFVVADPKRGMLVLEVKGGSIQQNDGRWFQNGHPMRQEPRIQALNFLDKLRIRLDRERCKPPAQGVATCFPDTPFDQPPQQDDLRYTTIGPQDLPHLRDALPHLLDRCLSRNNRAAGKWIETLHELWGESWPLTLQLGRRARLDESERLQLDEVQIRLLDSIERIPNALIEGGAGTGKTLLAREAASRFAAKGQRVLLLCFTSALAEWLRSTVTTPNVQISSLGKLAIDIANISGIELGELKNKEDWDALLLSVAVDGSPAVSQKWDVVVLDESQDLSAVDWDFVKELSRGKRFWVFHDPAQRFWTDRSLPAEISSFTPIVLQKSYRCSPAVLALADAYRNLVVSESAHELINNAMRDQTVNYVQCPSVSSVGAKINNEVLKLLSAGFAPGDIAIVSVRGQQGAKSLGENGFGTYRVAKADDPDAENAIVHDTFLRFKGLERPAVIVTDLDLVSDRLETRMYIAITRAMTSLRIVAPRDTLRNDLVFSALDV